MSLHAWRSSRSVCVSSVRRWMKGEKSDMLSFDVCLACDCDCDGICAWDGVGSGVGFVSVLEAIFCVLCQ